MRPTSPPEATRHHGDAPAVAARSSRDASPDRPDERESARSLRTTTVVGILCAQVVLVTAILGRPPLRGALLAGTILVLAVWAGSTVRARWDRSDPEPSRAHTLRTPPSPHA